MIYILREQIIYINSLIVPNATIIDSNTIDSYEGSLQYTNNLQEGISIIVRSTIKNHSFSDGNKRTATAVYLLLCKLNNIEIVKDNLEIKILDIANNHYSIDEIKNILFINK
jgi:death-on-curing family protein